MSNPMMDFANKHQNRSNLISEMRKTNNPEEMANTYSKMTGRNVSSEQLRDVLAKHNNNPKEAVMAIAKQRGINPAIFESIVRR